MANYNLREVLKQLGRNILSWVKTNCVNNCVSTTTNLPLAAAQGKVLQDQITTLNSNIEWQSTTIPGYNNSKIIYRTLPDGTKEEYGTLNFSDVGIQDPYYNVYYNASTQPWGIKFANKYSEITYAEIQPLCPNNFFFTTIQSWNNEGLKYWLVSAKPGTFNLALFYHIVGR